MQRDRFGLIYSEEERKWVVIEGNENGDFATTQIPYQRGRLKELQQLIGWKSEKEYWWEGKYMY